MTQQAVRSERERNWAGNHRYGAPELRHPGSVEELQALVRGASSVQALGSGHSFNAIADCAGIQVSLDGMPPVLEIDEAAMTVTVGGGSNYGTLAVALADRGLALAHLASLPHISVAGAV